MAHFLAQWTDAASLSDSMTYSCVLCAAQRGEEQEGRLLIRWSTVRFRHAPYKFRRFKSGARFWIGSQLKRRTSAFAEHSNRPLSTRSVHSSSRRAVIQDCGNGHSINVWPNRLRLSVARTPPEGSALVTVAPSISPAQRFIGLACASDGRVPQRSRLCSVLRPREPLLIAGSEPPCYRSPD